MFSPMMRASVLASFALALCTSWLEGQTIAPKTYAVLVGIDRYPDAKIKPRLHAEADIQALHALIVAKDHLGADPANVHLLLAQKGAKDGPADRKSVV